MTREEAIDRLKGLYGNGYNEQEEALEMAIQALEQEPCSDVVNRQAVLEALTKTSGIRGDALKALYDLPPVNPQEKTGHWEDCSNGWMCSVCKRDSRKDTNFCPNCGARMESET